MLDGKHNGSNDDAPALREKLARFAHEGRQHHLRNGSDREYQAEEGDVYKRQVYHFAKEDRVTRASEIDVTDEEALRELFS